MYARRAQHSRHALPVREEPRGAHTVRERSAQPDGPLPRAAFLRVLVPNVKGNSLVNPRYKYKYLIALQSP